MWSLWSRSGDRARWGHCARGLLLFIEPMKKGQHDVPHEYEQTRTGIRVSLMIITVVWYPYLGYCLIRPLFSMQSTWLPQISPHTHYSGVARASRRLKSPAHLFVQNFVWSDIKASTKLDIADSLGGEPTVTCDRWIPHTKGLSCEKDFHAVTPFDMEYSGLEKNSVTWRRHEKERISALSVSLN